jgi:hypothetical protein
MSARKQVQMQQETQFGSKKEARSLNEAKTNQAVVGFNFISPITL